MSSKNGDALRALDEALIRAAERERGLLTAEQQAEALVIKRLRQVRRAEAKVRRAEGRLERRRAQLTAAQDSLTQAQRARARGPLAEGEAE